MTANHTPGPWHVANGVQIRGEREQIAKVWMMRGGEGNANARLIAAAPELLEALKACAAVCAGETMNKRGLISALEQARAALSKCEGNQS